MSDGSFDYGDLAVRTTTSYAVKADAQFISGTVLLIFGVIGSLLVYVMLIRGWKRTSVGISFYAFFLVTCNIIYLVTLILFSF